MTTVLTFAYTKVIHKEKGQSCSTCSEIQHVHLDELYSRVFQGKMTDIFLKGYKTKIEDKLRILI